ncbi:GIY-YIG nuclease family protein [Clostridium sp.]|uniref:GIY-YIG nuclease family protein n=1 Tax=Clostridium sp. TaxID=1506 RepID=UPI001A476A1E|nr:GIY-YIG nuclease family protein [Clostridium sp.]MBK5239816.1 GIY-YIG nuclease family protein [Clostridium sp.]
MDCKGGIYKILNLVNGKMYVGSSINLKKRKEKHFSQLKNNRHSNRHLQSAYNKDGKENFKWIILEDVIDNSTILSREQYWIDFYGSSNCEVGYNLAPIAGNCLGVKYSDEIKQRMSINHKALNLVGEKSSKFGTHPSKETLKLMSESNSGEKSYKALLTNDQVKEIKRMIMAGFDNIEIGKKYGVSKEFVSAIKNGASWKNVNVEGISRDDLRNKNNRNQVGENNHNSKLTKEDVIQIKIMLKEGLIYKEIASVFNVSTGIVGLIKREGIYKDILIPDISVA